MTTHYHGMPITPREALDSLAGSYFCVSWIAQFDLARALEIGAGLMLDNGAYTFWRKRRAVDWRGFYEFAERYCGPTVWAVVPDIIDGDAAANDRLLDAWPLGEHGAPVWHMHESIARLLRLAERWPRVCIGSSRDYRIVDSPRWHGRMVEAMNALCGNGPAPVRLHMLRGMRFAGSPYPFDSVDSSDIARNHSRKIKTAATMARRWEARHCPTQWTIRPTQHALDLGGFHALSI